MMSDRELLVLTSHSSPLELPRMDPVPRLRNRRTTLEWTTDGRAHLLAAGAVGEGLAGGNAERLRQALSHLQAAHRGRQPAEAVRRPRPVRDVDHLVQKSRTPLQHLRRDDNRYSLVTRALTLSQKVSYAAQAVHDGASQLHSCVAEAFALSSHGLTSCEGISHLTPKHVSSQLP